MDNNRKNNNENISRINIVYDQEYEKNIRDWLLKQRFMNKNKDNTSKGKGKGKSKGTDNGFRK